MPRILIYEDHTDLRMALASLIGSTPEFELVGAFGDCLNVVAQCQALQPDVVLMDIEMPGRSGIEGLVELKRVLPATDVVMLTVFDDDERVFDAVCAGASGYLLKKTPPVRLLEALLEVGEGGAPMSPTVARKVLNLFPQGKKSTAPDLALLGSREAEVLTILAKGYSYKMVADELNISLETVRTHVKRIYEKLHVHSLAEATAKVFLK